MHKIFTAGLATAALTWSGAGQVPAAGASTVLRPYDTPTELAEKHAKEVAEHEEEVKKKEASEKQAREAAEAKQKEEQNHQAEARLHEEQEHTQQAREAEERKEHEQQEAERSGAGSTTSHCVVPRLEGDTVHGAKSALQRAHCRLGRVRTPHGARGHLVVVEQTVKVHSTRAVGTAVNVTLGVPKRHR